jgi:NAD(P)-dependent dehydrogenase (short-subunit alcohol dehydrogenase family)
MGRAAAIAYAREGAVVAINYYPTEEPDAQEVIALIKDTGRKGIPLPGDLRDPDFCEKLVLDAVNGLGSIDLDRITLCYLVKNPDRVPIR